MKKYIVFISLFYSILSNAGQCVTYPAENLFSEYAYVFLGKFVTTTTKKNLQEDTFQVIEQWKGDKKSYIKLNFEIPEDKFDLNYARSPFGETSLEKTHLIFASDYKNINPTSRCSSREYSSEIEIFHKEWINAIRGISKLTPEQLKKTSVIQAIKVTEVISIGKPIGDARDSYKEITFKLDKGANDGIFSGQTLFFNPNSEPFDGRVIVKEVSNDKATAIYLQFFEDAPIKPGNTLYTQKLSLEN